MAKDDLFDGSRSTRVRRAGWRSAAAILGVLLAIGLVGGAWQHARALLDFKQLDRSVVVKGLSEREVPADLAIWPLSYAEADNDVANLYRSIERKNAQLVDFLKAAGFQEQEISSSAPSVVDKQAREYGGNDDSPFRYTGRAAVTVYSTDVDKVRATMSRVGELGQAGIAIGGDHGARPEFLFTGLNAIKPEMIEEATRNARESAEKFARDSGSNLGKIRRASQGQFSIEDRDANTPHIKKLRVVSTVDYYLVD